MIDKALVALAIAFIVSVVVMLGTLIAGAPRWDLIGQDIEDAVATCAMWAAVISAPLLAILSIARALK